MKNLIIDKKYMLFATNGKKKLEHQSKPSIHSALLGHMAVFIIGGLGENTKKRENKKKGHETCLKHHFLE
jgi:hypothetical protein